ncbi:hypothetical protein DB30_05799 [Enhygromyxa salina]|uniref:Uncharacterized protein n=1 Tax=Enhygromyxa salina TaxID=215803 RepID=A0A0C2D0A2_9BACT|nr:hypothetical protein [Enhygromyxa salina]KIG15255.1 hypothetical protein DB30_05799 [Enhygromyxa salina]
MNNDLLGKLSICGVALLLSLPAVNGCKSDDTADADGDTSGDGDGDGDTTGDGDGDPGDGDGDPTGDGDGDPTGDGDGDGVSCEETHAPGDGAANGDPCFSNGDCASKLCEVFQDVPPVEGTCEEASPTDVCETRIMGRVLDFTTRQTVADVNLRVAQAIQASVDPVGAAPLASGTSDANGIIDTLSDGQIASALGIVGLADGGSYYLTATGLASPATGTNYGPANAIHDIWVVPSQSLTDWSDALMTDAEFANHLPLGESGGVVGLVRDVATGDLIEGAVVVPTKGNSSNAVIRYLNAAGDDFVTEATTTSGVFVIVNPDIGETFGVEIGGEDQGITGTGGSSSGAIFTLVMNVSM